MKEVGPEVVTGVSVAADWFAAAPDQLAAAPGASRVAGAAASGTSAPKAPSGSRPTADAVSCSRASSRLLGWLYRYRCGGGNVCPCRVVLFATTYDTKDRPSCDPPHTAASTRRNNVPFVRDAVPADHAAIRNVAVAAYSQITLRVVRQHKGAIRLYNIR